MMGVVPRRVSQLLARFSAGPLLLVLVLLAAGCDRNATDNRPPEQIWREVCAACHGLGGEGIPHKLGRRVDMRAPEWQASLTDAQIRSTIIDGKKGESKRMPAWGERFSEEQIAGLVKYLRETIARPAGRP